MVCRNGEHWSINREQWNGGQHREATCGPEPEGVTESNGAFNGGLHTEARGAGWGGAGGVTAAGRTSLACAARSSSAALAAAAAAAKACGRAGGV